MSLEYCKIKEKTTADIKYMMFFCGGGCGHWKQNIWSYLEKGVVSRKLVLSSPICEIFFKSKGKGESMALPNIDILFQVNLFLLAVVAGHNLSIFGGGAIINLIFHTNT